MPPCPQPLHWLALLTVQAPRTLGQTTWYVDAFTAPQIVRTSLQTNSTVGGLTGCAGSFSLRWTNARTSASAIPPFVNLHAQFWSRDPGSASGTSLSNSVRVFVRP